MKNDPDPDPDPDPDSDPELNGELSEVMGSIYQVNTT
jgi:hypothetical protein